MMNVVPFTLASSVTRATDVARSKPYLIDTTTDFGVIGDGVTDNADALLAMRQYMDDNPQYHYELHFPTGNYVYSNNIWLNNVRSVTLYGNGSTFQNINNGTNHIWQRNSPFYSRFPWDDAPPGTMLTYTGGGGKEVYCPQARFERAEVGSTILTLRPPVDGEPYLDISDIAPGDQIMIWGYDQQFGHFPPNLRHFEWNTIKSVDVAAGTVTLELGLRHTYEAEAREITYLTAGAARFFKLHRPSPVNKRYAEYVEFRDMIFKPNPKEGISNLFFPCRHWILKNVENLYGDLWGGANELIYAEDCQFMDSDIDKLIGTCHLRRCTFKKDLQPASGAEHFIVEDCFIGGTFTTAARRTKISGCIIGGALNAAPMRGKALASVKTILVENNQFTSPETLVYSLRMDDVATLVPTSTNANTIRLADTELNRNIMQVIDVGSYLVNDTEQLAVRVGRVWYYDASSEFVIETDLDSLPTVNWMVVHGQDIRVRNNVRYRPGFPHRDEMPSVYRQVLPIENGRIRITPLMDVQIYVLPLRAFVRTITAHVVRPQRNPPAEHPDPVAMIDVRQGGTNGTEVAGFDMPLNAIGSTTVTAKPYPVYADTFRVKLQQQAWQVNGLRNLDTDSPILHIDLEAEPIA